MYLVYHVNYTFFITLVFQEHYLPYIMRSKVKLMLHGDKDQQTLLDFVDAAMKNPEQKSLLEVCLEKNKCM